MKRLLVTSATSLLLLLGNSAQARQDAHQLNPEAVVLSITANILHTDSALLQPEAPFAQQHPVSADALDVVEIIMAVEDALQLKIDDSELDRRIGASDESELAQKLTIRQLQSYVRELWENATNRKKRQAA
ncbi:hypothetical protein V8J88_12830 [Massilia sp. W12]|uniref:hypothetical protein n=1 Tax=Massilia sp. W12 TaxID=3126507 RepID=UPI0030D51917